MLFRSRSDISVSLLSAEKEGAKLNEFFEVFYKADNAEHYILGLQKKSKKK